MRKLVWGFHRDVREGSGLLGSDPASNPRIFLTRSFYYCPCVLHLWVLYRRRLFLIRYEVLHILTTYCNRSSSRYRTRGDLDQCRLNFSAISLESIVLDVQLFLRPQYVPHGETQFVSVIMISHGKRLCKNVGLRVKCQIWQILPKIGTCRQILIKV